LTKLTTTIIRARPLEERVKESVMEGIFEGFTIKIFLTSMIMIASLWWLSLSTRTLQPFTGSMTNHVRNPLLRKSLRYNLAHVTNRRRDFITLGRTRFTDFQELG